MIIISIFDFIDIDVLGIFVNGGMIILYVKFKLKLIEQSTTNETRIHLNLQNEFYSDFFPRKDCNVLKSCVNRLRDQRFETFRSTTNFSYRQLLKLPFPVWQVVNKVTKQNVFGNSTNFSTHFACYEHQYRR